MKHIEESVSNIKTEDKNRLMSLNNKFLQNGAYEMMMAKWANVEMRWKVNVGNKRKILFT